MNIARNGLEPELAEQRESVLLTASNNNEDFLK